MSFVHFGFGPFEFVGLAPFFGLFVCTSEAPFFGVGKVSRCAVKVEGALKRSPQVFWAAAEVSVIHHRPLSDIRVFAVEYPKLHSDVQKGSK